MFKNKLIFKHNIRPKNNPIIKNNFNLSNKKILFFSPDITWNQYCGNSIWAIGFLRLLKKKYKCDISAVECTRFSNNEFTNIFKVNNPDIKFINLFGKNNFQYFPHLEIDMIPGQIQLNYFLKSTNFDYIIIRGMEFMNYIINNFESKVII